MTTTISGGTVQFYLHESDFAAPIPATRLSDGTIRFVALLATLLTPDPPRVVCIEEPELGLHPDAVALLADVLVDASDRMQLRGHDAFRRLGIGADQSARRDRCVRATGSGNGTAAPRSEEARLVVGGVPPR